MNNKIGPRSLAAPAAITAAGILMAQAAWAAFDSAAVPADFDLKVLRVVPAGDQVPAPGRQIVVTLDRPVVAIGLMAVDAGVSPVGISPSVNCLWHWLDPRSLACELTAAQALASATRYTVTLAAGITAQNGAKLKQPYRWAFTTGRPAVHGYSFTTWRSPGTPVLRLVFNQPVSQDSVEANLHFGDVAGVVTTPDPYDDPWANIYPTSRLGSPTFTTASSPPAAV